MAEANGTGAATAANSNKAKKKRNKGRAKNKDELRSGIAVNGVVQVRSTSTHCSHVMLLYCRTQY